MGDRRKGGVSEFRHDGIAHLSVIRRHLSAVLRHNTPKKFLNLCRAEYAMWQRKPVTKGYPFAIKIEPTRRCNLACPGCPSGGGSETEPRLNLPFATFKHTVDELAAYLYKITLYGWGEPLLNKEVYDMIKYAQSKDIAVAVSTNGMALNEANCEKLIAAGLEYLIVSVDGVTQDGYERYRVGGVLETVTANISTMMRVRRLRNSRLPLVTLQYLVTSEADAEVGAVRQLALDLGVDSLALKSFYHEGQSCFAAEIDTAGASSGEVARSRVIIRKKPCYWLWSATEVLYDGTVIPCCFKSTKPAVGNVNAESIRSIWNNEVYQANRLLFSRSLKENPPKALQECLNCSLFV